jgi:uncharacterized membrane protein
MFTRVHSPSKTGVNSLNDALCAGMSDACQGQDTTALWNIHVSDWVVSPHTRRGVGRGHGKM